MSADIEDLLQKQIPAALKELEYNASGQAANALAAEFQELDREYSACCSSVANLTGDATSAIQGECGHSHLCPGLYSGS